MHVILEDMSGNVVTELDLDDATADRLVEMAKLRDCTVEDVILDSIRAALANES